MSVRVLHGDCRDVLPTLDAESFDCCVTSPPYWGLRDYGVEGQIGLEPTLDAYLETMVGVCRDINRVLKPSGTFWLNIGDSYTSGGRKSRDPGQSKIHPAFEGDAYCEGLCPETPVGLKPKDLCMVPARLALRLQADGWWLRSEIIWAKPNPMPESVTDRPTSAHEKVWLLTKSERYAYDAAAIADESCNNGTRPQRARAEQLAKTNGLTQAHIEALRSCGVGDAGKAQSTQTGFGKNSASVQALADEAKKILGGYTREFLIAETRNARNVWTIPSQPYSGAHFATMPPALAERCIKAGCPLGGSVLDPFSGAGTTGLVADRLGRDATLIDLKPEYRDMAAERIRDDAPLFADVTKEKIG